MAKKVIPGELTDVDVKYVSLVKKGANKQKISIYKEDDSEELTKTGKNAELEGENTSELFKTGENDVLDKDKSLFNVIKSWFEKQDVNSEKKTVSFSEKIAAREAIDNLWQATSTFSDSIREIARDDDVKDKKAAYNKVIDEFSAYMKKKLTSESIAKSDAFFNEESEDEMNLEEIRKAIKETVEETVKPLAEKVASLEKEDDEQGAAATEPGKEDSIEAIIKEAVTESMSDIKKRVERIENARGLAKSEEGEEKVEKTDETDIFGGLFI